MLFSLDDAATGSLVATVTACTDCRLCLQRTNVVVARSGPVPWLMLIGEAPGEEEDRTGLPFVGPSGQLLSRLLKRAEVPEERVYFTNVVKCRPPSNRNPHPDEVKACRHFLLRQIRESHPRCLITAGKIATSSVTGVYGTMGALLGEVDLTCKDTGLPVVAVYPPAYLLRRLNDPGARYDFQNTVARLKSAWLMSTP